MPYTLVYGPLQAKDPDDTLKTFFRQNVDGDGRLDKNKLAQAFRDLGSVMPNWRASRALRYADDDGDGFITATQEMDRLVSYVKRIGLF